MQIFHSTGRSALEGDNIQRCRMEPEPARLGPVPETLNSPIRQDQSGSDGRNIDGGDDHGDGQLVPLHDLLGP